MHEVDEEGKPTHVRGLRIGLENETREFDAVVAALDVPGIKKVSTPSHLTPPYPTLAPP